MGCIKREKTGSCSHFQCPYCSETSHGYECVELITERVDNGLISFCEMGEGCVPACSYSWRPGEGTLLERASKQFINNSPNN